ncbi:hypothetical protein ACI3P6_16675, partial [Lacticaseibacillus paracasei]
LPSMQLSHSAGGNHTIFSFQVKEVSHMDRQQMIEALMSYRDDKPKAFWETMDDDMLEMAISAERERARNEMIDYLATA